MLLGVFSQLPENHLADQVVPHLQALLSQQPTRPAQLLLDFCTPSLLGVNSCISPPVHVCVCVSLGLVQLVLI